ncbi:hypothetical protein M409DRAFT_62565 [Zasmidium cellare ATCC 36951]|uniref:Tudor domain-containing protein n=1 Tax=Zasmidium cellare ATCC 36951 TaxID=1080233 RepID=A0A6A6D0B7_ZASCE|nr:uncharacterized protein M409DRAFT_62565 [Zasmidium cellare ATCC 36951]KAF2172907.1 hypothetical protein M409DRAFT_62565 [Zasmidium cellare ATCC 36951]
MSTLAELKEELATSQNDLDWLVNEALVADPNDADSLEMKANLEESIADLKSRIAAKTSAPPPPPPADGPAPKYDMSKHPKFRKTSEEAAPPPPPDETRVQNFNTGDSVMAKYSVDKQWYAATIVGKTGSSADPVYSVKFTGYPDRENKRKHEVRAVENKKRKAEGPPPPPSAPATAAIPPPPPPTTVQNGAVISAAPSIDPSLVQKREPSKVSDGPTRMPPAPKKLKGGRTLEKTKNSWKDWQKTGPKKPVGSSAKMVNKESQFRTPDLPNAKVGFTGSGKAMTKDQARTKWNYTHEEPEED